MTTIVPRWEWRTFGTDFGVAEDLFAALEPTAIQESNEVYLRTGSGPIVKIRDELMDVKVLQAVSPEGLEQWVPVMKEGFPLAATDVTKVFEMLDDRFANAGARLIHPRPAPVRGHRAPS